MLELKSLKIDGSFPDFGTEKLAEYLNNGWSIRDKTVLNARYVLYTLEKLKSFDADVGKCSDGLSSSNQTGL